MSMLACTSQTAEQICLTNREREVLSLIAEGNSNAKVADLLFISRRTVEFHLRIIYTKLDVNSRLGAYHTAVRLGLLPPMTVR